jgi:lipopolysaccharide transport system permease protein
MCNFIGENHLNEINKQWTTVISAKKRGINLGLNELKEYRFLMFLFFRRDFTALYKQTVLGPAWYLIQPLFTMVVFAFIFGNLAGMGTDDIPPYLFYLSGIIMWRLFADTMTNSSRTFNMNKGLFGKVYFPRLTVPISGLGANLVAFFIQLFLLLGIYFYYIYNGMQINIHWTFVFFPFIVIMICFLGLGFGLLITSMTTKYRDLQFVVGFIIQLWMYATPVAYPLSELSGKVSKSISWVFWLNPISFPIEFFRYMIFQSNTLDWSQGIVSISITLILFILGVANFNRVERDFMDRI